VEHCKREASIGLGAYLPCITLLNIHRKQDSSQAHSYVIPKRFLIPRNKITSTTSTDTENRSFLFLFNFIRFVSKLFEKRPCCLNGKNYSTMSRISEKNFVLLKNT
jgi:hypothetical protein